MMPALALIGIPGPRWLPPLPLPLFLLWPLVLIGQGITRLFERSQSSRAAKLRNALEVFGELRGLAIAVDTADHKQVRIRFI